MIPPIPASGPLPDPPTCCTDVFDFAERLLNWIWTGTESDPGIAECVGADGPCGPVALAVTHGPPIIPLKGSVLAVYLQTPAMAVHLPNRGGSGPAIQMVALTDVSFGIELWEACYPVPADDGTGPSFAQFHEANRHSYAHATALWRRLLDGYRTQFGQINAGCQAQRLDPLVPLAPGAPGLSVGWKTGLRALW